MLKFNGNFYFYFILPKKRLTLNRNFALVFFRYVFSGYESIPPHFNPDVYKLDLTTLVWTLVNCSGIPPLPRDFHTATAVGDFMFIFGGRSGEQEQENQRVGAFDIISRTLRLRSISIWHQDSNSRPLGLILII